MSHLANAQAFQAGYEEVGVIEAERTARIKTLAPNTATPFEARPTLRKALRPDTLPTAKKQKVRSLTQEDMQIVQALETLKQELDYLHNSYDQATDPLLVDSIIYAIKAANTKYMYYLNLCKAKRIVIRF